MNDARHLGEYRLASQYCFPNYFLASCEKLFLQQDDLDKFEEQICRQEETLPLLMKFDKEGKLAQLLDVLEVHLKNGKSGVFVFQPQDQKIQFKEVDLIRLTSDGQAIITSTQLKAGDVVVSAGTHSINDGETVRPLPAQTLTNVGGLL